LLLVVVLALGVFVMHTLGHPEDSSHSGMRASSHAAAMGHPAADVPDGSSTHEPAVPMDLMSLCVAVLFGALVLAALLKAASARARHRATRLLAQADGRASDAEVKERARRIERPRARRSRR
jgi:hypothetical protein